MSRNTFSTVDVTRPPTCLVGVAGAVLAIVLIGFAIWIIGFFVLGVWAIYRIARGWMALRDAKPVAA